MSPSRPTSPLTYVEEQNSAIKEKLHEMLQLCTDGACPPWIQILLEQADHLDVTGKVVKDIVLIPITQGGGGKGSQFDGSRLNSSNNMGTTPENMTQYAWDSNSLC